MPRQVRCLSESKIYHVMVRGNEKKNIFMDEEDKERYIETLSRLSGHALCGKETTQSQCPVLRRNNERKFGILAYCLMNNHAHLLIHEGEDEISRIMKRIGISYVYYFNKKYGRVGPLFQDRFKSETVEDDAYLLAVVRYIHNNPVKAGLAENASGYPWSSFNAYIEAGNGQELIDRDQVLELLSADRKKAIALFIEYTAQENRDEFLEYVEVNEEKEFIGRQEAGIFAEKFLREKGMSLHQINDKKNVALRNELICRLKTGSNLSIRELAELLKLNRGVIQRIKP